MKKRIIAALCTVLLLLSAVCAVHFLHNEPQKEATPALSEEKEHSNENEEVPSEALKEADEVNEPNDEIENEANKENTGNMKEAPAERTEMSCMLSVRCDTALSNRESMDSAKAEMLPENGVIFPETAVYFSEGESVYDVLAREMMNAKIHMESENTPMYQSAYIEGIANLYEYDCGPLSGWMYKVNGEFPNIGCSSYKLTDGDIIEWVYTCDLGADVGNENT